MDRTEALARLGRMVASDQRPVLSDADLGDVLDGAATIDADGYRPTDPGYTPTWDLDRAAAEGWTRKAGRVAGDFSFSADGASFNKGDVLAHCEAMAATYRARGVHVLTVADDRLAGPYRSPRLQVNG